MDGEMPPQAEQPPMQEQEQMQMNPEQQMQQQVMDVNDAQLAQEEAFLEAQAQSLAEVKRRRKDIERDAQLLANRIALLKQEEQKTWKKIDDTKKRTNEILTLKKRNEDRIQKKIYDYQNQNDQQRMVAQNNYAINKQRQDEKRKVQEAIFQSRREEAKQSKIIKQQNEQKKKFQHFKVEQENRMKNQIVNQQKRLAAMKIEEDRTRRVQQVQRHHDDRVVNEDYMRTQKEEEVMQMEKLEMELIKKLQNTQAVQKEAYQELERALKEPSAMMAPQARGAPIQQVQPQMQ